MVKIAYIGAGSAGFGKQLVAGILSRPELAAGTLALVDVNEANLQVSTRLARKMAEQLGVSPRIEPTTDRREALDGADFVLSTITAAGGIEARMVERRISEKYGVDQAVGCTTGPGGVFRTLRYMPGMLAICRDLEELCPQAWLLHYANPTAAVSLGLNRASPVHSLGMCHSVQGTARYLARCLGVPFEETGHWVAGVNHQAWVLRFERLGEDAYPQLRQKMAAPEIYDRDVVRCEMMKHFGYFVTESSYHNSEYVPYFRKNPELIARFTPKTGRWHDHQASEQKEVAAKRVQLAEEAAGSGPVEIPETQEYSINIIHAMVTDTAFRFNGNVMNTGLITNLPDSLCVEVPCLVDNMGVHPCHVGELPAQCAMLNASRSAGDELSVKGALEGDRDAVRQAVALDPLTAAVCTLDQVADMVDELFEALTEYLPQFR